MIIKSEIICKKCKREIHGTITLNENNQVIDSSEFMVFGDGCICDSCCFDGDLHPDTIIHLGPNAHSKLSKQ